MTRQTWNMHERERDRWPMTFLWVLWIIIYLPKKKVYYKLKNFEEFNPTSQFEEFFNFLFSSTRLIVWFNFIFFSVFFNNIRTLNSKKDPFANPINVPSTTHECYRTIREKKNIKIKTRIATCRPKGKEKTYISKITLLYMHPSKRVIFASFIVS